MEGIESQLSQASLGSKVISEFTKWMDNNLQTLGIPNYDTFRVAAQTHLVELLGELLHPETTRSVELDDGEQIFWMTNSRGTTGILLTHRADGEPIVYTSVVPGHNEVQDIALIRDWGGKFNLRAIPEIIKHMKMSVDHDSV